jgi:glutaredoxin
MKKILILSVMAITLIMPLAETVTVTRSMKNNATVTPEKVTQGDFTHTVLIEYISKSTCPYCPTASSQLQSIYTSGDYDFYYVTVVTDKIGELPELAQLHLAKRLQELGVKYVPNVYVDGGYKDLRGAQQDEQPYKDAINQSGQRTVPDINIDVRVEWKGSGVIKIKVTIQNNDPEEYNGHFRVYVVEKESTWNNADGNPYRFVIVDIPMDKNLAPQQHQARHQKPLSDTYTYTKLWKGDITQDNSLVIASVFDKDTGYTVQTASAEPMDTSSFFSNIVSYLWQLRLRAYWEHGLGNTLS